MDRRDFLKLATSGVAAVSMLKSSLWQPRSLMAANSHSDSMSLNVLTDRPDVAISRIENLLNQLNLNARTLTFEDFMLPGVQTGDIVMVRNNALVDYRRQQDDLSRQLLQISRELDLPRTMKEPVLLQFSTPDNGQKATRVNVFHRQTLVRQFDIAELLDGEEIRGTSGALNLTLKHGHARIVAASCKHKTCMNMGSIHKPAQNLVCIPNELRIAIAGTDNLGIDGIAF